MATDTADISDDPIDSLARPLYLVTEEQWAETGLTPCNTLDSR